MARNLRELKPKTLTGIRSLGRDMKKSFCISHNEGLNQAARRSGYLDYNDAVEKLGK